MKPKPKILFIKHYQYYYYSTYDKKLKGINDGKWSTQKIS